MIGSRLAHYHITAHLGSGGMGDVFQATDSKLGRSVAIKLLPETVAHDTDRLTRFEREARMLASLNHSNIAAIHGIEESGDRKFIVMELVDGETLAERIKREPIPVDEALVIAKQILEALEAAHEKGVIHRDLKPANIKITTDGKVKVLDFGLAKADETGVQQANLSHSPTMAGMAATNAGVILGTAAYMSPEQAKGRAVDRRTDVFAFGCVLYEMLTGRPAFDGDDVTDIIGAVLKMEPDWTRIPANVPPPVQKLLRLCLEKDVKRRRRDAGDVLLDMDLASTPIVIPTRGRWLSWMIAGVVSLAVASIALLYFRPPAAVLPEMRLEISTPSTQTPHELALSPDGRYIVFVASGDGPQRLWLRPLDKTESLPLSGTEEADYPFWSADSRSIGFFAKGKLFRIDVSGGSTQPLANASAGRGGTWNADGTILFSPDAGSSVMRLQASGGTPVAVTRLNAPHQTSHRFPRFLPDGRHFVFHVQGAPETAGLYLGTLDGGDPKRLAAAGSSGAYLTDEFIVFLRQTALMAARLDLMRGELTGEPVTLADPVSSATGGGGFSTSNDGRLAYRSGGAGLRQLKWYDRTGKLLSAVGEPQPDSLNYPDLSPDGGRVVVQRTLGNTDVWLVDLLRGGFTRFTFDPSIDNLAVWSHDGSRIAFSSKRNGPGNLYVKLASLATAEEVVYENGNLKYPRDWSHDGRFLVYTETDPKTGQDLWALPLSGADKKPIVVANAPFEESNGQFSPDGRWIAYETNESGRSEIVVQPFPPPSAKWPVSTNGGVQPRWRADTKELYFIAPDGRLMAASVSINGSTLTPGTPVVLFPARVAPGAGANKQQYDVDRAGRFLINQSVEEATATPITVLLNWKPK